MCPNTIDPVQLYGEKLNIFMVHITDAVDNIAIRIINALCTRLIVVYTLYVLFKFWTKAFLFTRFVAGHTNTGKGENF